MHNPRRIYLAGPEVFFQPGEHRAIVNAKKQILNAQGLIGVDPLDSELAIPDGLPGPERGRLIYQANRELMDCCDAVIANLTPFRGISADPGTVFEVGYMTGQGKPAFGFTLDQRRYRERAGGTDRDAGSYLIEDFELIDNLMIECGIVESGGQVMTGTGDAGQRYFSAEVFGRCASAVQHHYAARERSGV